MNVKSISGDQIVNRRNSAFVDIAIEFVERSGCGGSPLLILHLWERWTSSVKTPRLASGVETNVLATFLVLSSFCVNFRREYTDSYTSGRAYMRSIDLSKIGIRDEQLITIARSYGALDKKLHKNCRYLLEEAVERAWHPQMAVIFRWFCLFYGGPFDFFGALDEFARIRPGSLVLSSNSVGNGSAFEYFMRCAAEFKPGLLETPKLPKRLQIFRILGLQNHRISAY